MSESEVAYRGQAPARLDEVAYPLPADPVIVAPRVVMPGVRIPLFHEDIWDLSGIEKDVARSSTPVHFENWPSGFKDFAKHVAYVLINHGNPPELLEAPGSRYTKWPAVGSLKHALDALKVQVEWLTSEPDLLALGPRVVAPADLDPEHLERLRRWVEGRGNKPHRTNAMLEIVLRVWWLSPWLPEDVRWPEPEWAATRWRTARNDGEHLRIRIPQDVMAPLLEWAVSFVTVFADDIFAADAHYRARLETQAAQPSTSARMILEEYLRQGTALPADPKQKGRVGWQAVRYAQQGPVRHLAETYSRQFRGRIPLSSAPGKLDFEPAAQFHGGLWIPTIFVHDVAPQPPGGDGANVLLGHLRTACLIVCAYLTGARPEEVLLLETGAARDPIVRADGSRLHLIDGLVWKGTRSRVEDGHPGEPKRATWATISVTTTAVRVAERVNHVLGRPGGRLFVLPDTRVSPDTATIAISSFVNFVNTRLAPHTLAPAAFTIPDDGHALSLGRFRRTLAWFINNRPDGDVSLAIQYQHVSDRLVSGYAGTKQSGMRDLLLEENWQHRRRTTQHLSEMIRSGAQLTGPAASRATTIALGMPRFLTPADERRLKRDKDIVIYENPSAIALCIYDEKRALCRKRSQAGGWAAPTLVQCVDGCPNCARTEEHLDTLQADAASLRMSALLSPKPIAQSLLARAERNERIVNDARSS